MEQVNTFIQIILEVAICAIFIFIIEDLFKKHKAKKVFYIEDSKLEAAAFRSRVHLDNTIVNYFFDLTSALNKMYWVRPDYVIVDYHLPDGKGDEIYKACERLHIPVRVVTVEEGMIKGVDENKIIHKKKDFSHLDKIDSWLNKRSIA